ncbi:PREDICTED: circadian clock-controlled protein-like isoform X2 [Nicrophorus vespilloides]|uniref:Circadian clock-controlled protein-like isoform X2 n=1 Tax=Nicrophorus vespilloides TaxID=110193 RepID=A0ABM1N2D4_NICVS|nr:PREDICTED: circadian clock-controlled protein-like isoform X2 [Nicrophorus vespilloides]
MGLQRNHYAEYILPCYKADPEINTCLRGTFNHLRPYLINGLTDINVPSIDPLIIDRLLIENGHGAFRIRALFNNITVNGASNYTIGKIKADVDHWNIELGINLPRIEIRGKYEVGGNVLLFPVRSKGNFWAIFLEVEAAAKIFGKEIENEEGVRFMKIERMLTDFKLGKSRFRVRDVVNNGNIIGEAINQFLNNNADEIIREMKPAASQSISRHFAAFLNSAFLKVPIKVWLPDA